MNDPPPYVRTVYDETLRAISYIQPSIDSMANSPNLLGQLEHHSPQTDGSFAICIASGTGVFISKALLESVPSEHRPVLDTAFAGQSIQTFGSSMTALGTTFFPVIFTNADSGERVRVVLYAFVVPKLFMGMFIGGGSVGFLRSSGWNKGVPTHTFDFGQGGECRVKGI